MDNQSLFTGILSQDSPGLDLTLRKYLIKSEYENLRQAYLWVYESQGFDESPVTRSPGVNFNPKPARYCQILISNLDERSASQFISAMLMSVSPTHLVGANNFPIESARALEAQEMCNHGIRNTSLSRETEALITTKLLDEVRHMHMSSLGIEHIEAKLALISREIIPFLSLSRMKILLQSAVERAQIFHIDRLQ